jgi:transcriptional regulator with XRE-family HTH domain
MDPSQFPKRHAAVIGAKVRHRRVGDNLTEDAVARVLGCDVAHLRAAELGEIDFTPEDLVGLCPILRVTPSWFFEDLV